MFCFLVRFQNTKQKTQITKHKTQNTHHTQTEQHTHTHTRTLHVRNSRCNSECRFRCRWFSQKLWCSYCSYSSSDQIVFSTSWSATRTWIVLPKCDFRVFRVSLWVNHVNSCVNSCHRRTRTLTMDGAQRWPFGRAADFVDSTTWIYLGYLGSLVDTGTETVPSKRKYRASCTNFLWLKVSTCSMQLCFQLFCLVTGLVSAITTWKVT